MVEVREGYKMTELGEIPEEWEVTKLKEVTKVVNGATPSKSVEAYWKNGDIAWATPTDITKNSSKFIESTLEKITEFGLEKSSVVMLPAGSVLMTSRATIGACSINTIPMTTNQGFKSFICGERINNEYLYYLIHTLKSSFIEKASGSTFIEISKSAVENQEIVLPPLQEQQKIAEILSSVDTQIEKTEQMIEKTKELKKGLMQQLLTKGIGHTEFKQSELGEIPVSWECKKLDEVAERITVGIATSSTNHYVSFGVPMIRNQNIKEQYIDLTDVLYIDEDFDNANKNKRLKEGDLVTVRTGYPGQTAVVPKELEDAQTFTTLITTPCKDLVNPYYLSYLINSPIGMNQLNNIAAGGAQKNINAASLKQLKVTLPPLEEQQQIAEILSTVDAEIDSYEQERAKYEDLKKGLMQQLLTGKIRVKVDD